MEILNPVFGHRLRLSYYESREGPRLMLFGPIDVDIASLQNCFRSLSKGEGPVKLHEAPFIAAFGGVELRAVCTGTIGARGGAKTVYHQGLERCVPNAPSFEWSRSAEGWDYLAELISPLATLDGRPAHQYLTRYPGEAAIVVVSRGEYPDSVLSGEG